MRLRSVTQLCSSPGGRWMRSGVWCFPFLALFACAGTVPSSPLLTGLVEITAGERHTCALTTAGGVKCWGLNHEGQIGDGTKVDRSTPVDVVGLMSGMKTITAGEQHTCALTVSGRVKCWGGNDDGQLGIGTKTDSRAPVDVAELTSGAKAIGVGGQHTCAVSESGSIKCWGLNHDGQLGDGTKTDNSLPVDVVGLTSGMKAIAVGRRHTCAVTDTGGSEVLGSQPRRSIRG
jgi:alpha-tubulin suppressor-like RCC1 family protein